MMIRTISQLAFFAVIFVYYTIAAIVAICFAICYLLYRNPEWLAVILAVLLVLKR